jgi:hypothetical protein
MPSVSHSAEDQTKHTDSIKDCSVGAKAGWLTLPPQS